MDCVSRIETIEDIKADQSTNRFFYQLMSEEPELYTLVSWFQVCHRNPAFATFLEERKEPELDYTFSQPY